MEEASDPLSSPGSGGSCRRDEEQMRETEDNGEEECQEPRGGGADHLCLARRRKLPSEGLLQGDRGR